jgi:hypothetical protein
MGGNAVNGRAVNFFAPLSSYNLFLSFAIASTETAGEENILLLPDYNEANEKSLAYLGKRIPVFSGVIRLVKGKRRETCLTRPFRKRQLFRAVDELFSHNRAGKLFVFNDLKYQSQYAIATLARMQPLSRRIYVEDGTADYCGIRTREKGRLRRLRDRFFYKGWWRELLAFGTHPLLDEYRFLFPEFSNLHEAADERPKHGISNEGIPRLVCEEEARRCFGPIDAEAISGRESIILFPDAPGFARAHPGYFDKLAQTCERAISEGMNVLFKGKNRNNYPEMGFEGDPHFFDIPADIPSELALLWFREGIREIVGGKSSALMTARWLVPEIPCFSICSFMTEKESRLGSLFRNIGIRPYEKGEAW